MRVLLNVMSKSTLQVLLISRAYQIRAINSEGGISLAEEAQKVFLVKDITDVPWEAGWY